MLARSVGALEVTDERTRFVRFGGGRRTAALLLAVAAGWLLGRQ